MLCIGILRYCRAFRGGEGPMSLVLGSLIDPFAQNSLLFLRQRLPAVDWRHMVVVTDGQEDPVDQFAVLGIPLDDRGIPRLGGLEGSLCQVETQTALPFLFIGAVTVKAGIRQDGSNVAIEL